MSAAFLLSCAKAGTEHVKPHGPVFEAPGVFRIGHPGAGWSLHRNQRHGERLLLDYRHEDGDIDLRVTVHPLDDVSRSLPLATLAEGLVLHYGRKREIFTEVHAVQRVDFGAHEGWVVHATRSWKPNFERKMAQGFIRTSEAMVMLTYIAPPGLYEAHAADYAYALESFAVLLPPEKPRLALPDDLPQKHEDDGGSVLPVTTPPPPSTTTTSSGR